MTINGPLVSVLMTAFNRELFIAEAIESVLNSTFKDFELIVVDDCSKDKTVDIARKYESMDKRVRVFRNDENLGDYPNRNRALSIATGEYIMFVDSDDKILIDGIQQCVDWMIKYPESNFGIFSTMSLEMNIVNSIESLQLHFFKKPFLLDRGVQFKKQNLLDKSEDIQQSMALPMICIII
jgi:glycosyltransferase involved in cell wall biosynthesis